MVEFEGSIGCEVILAMGLSMFMNFIIFRQWLVGRKFLKMGHWA